MRARTAIFVVLIPLLAACSTKGSSPTEVDSQEAALESGITALNGLIDEQNSASGFSLRKPRSAVEPIWEPVWEPISAPVWKTVWDWLPRAWAATCTRAVLQSCSSAAKSITYSGCTGAGGLVSFSGTVSLSWNGDGDCALEDGETVSRTYSLTLTGTRGATLTISSANALNYEGTTLGGGGSITQSNSSSWQANIAGKHKSLTYGGNELYDISLKTGSAIGISGTLARAGRTVTGGSLIVYHNLAEFTATYQPVNLTYNLSSCHPQSGTMLVTYSGSLTGTATVQFTGGGNATIVRNGASESISLTYCE